MPVFIYCLKDPTTGDVRYIGQTNNPKRRLKQHLKGSIKEKTHLGNWLRSLEGEEPILALLHEVAENESWAEEERRYISCARALGVKLVNLTDGGEGFSGLARTPEHRAAIRAAQRSGECRTPFFAVLMAAQVSGERGPLGTPLCAAPKGVSLSPNHCLAMRVPKSPEHGRAVSAALMGRAKSLEHRLALSRAAKVSWARRKALS